MKSATATKRDRSMLTERGLQITLLGVFWLIGEGIVRLTGLPIPGGLVGMAIVLVALASGSLRIQRVQRGADWLLAEMLLFFIPAVPAILDHREFLGWLGLKVLAVIALGTLMVMATTALAVEAGYRWLARHDRGD